MTPFEKRVIARTFPAFKGRRVSLKPRATVTFHDLHWGGGTRSQYACYDLATDRAAVYGGGESPWKEPAEGLTLPIPPGCIIVESTVFQGKQLPLTFYYNPNDAQLALAAEFVVPA